MPQYGALVWRKNMFLINIVWKIAIFPFRLLFGKKEKRGSYSPFSKLLGLVNFLIGSVFSVFYLIGVATISRLVDQGVIQNWLTTHTPKMLTTPITINVFGILVNILNFLLGIVSYLFDLIIKFTDFLLPQYHSFLSSIPAIPHHFTLPGFLSNLSIVTNKTIVDLIPFITSLDQFYQTLNLNIGIVSVAIFTFLMITLIYAVFSGSIPNRIARLINWFRYKRALRQMRSLTNTIRSLETRQGSIEIGEYDRLRSLKLELDTAYQGKEAPVI
jgi:hypothetical protein